jgi:hypothetical protein
MKKQFYEKILPTQGVYCAAGIKAGKVLHRFAETIDELHVLTDRLKDEGFNVYVAPSTFEGHSRKTEDAVYSRSFFVDLDVNHGIVCYTSKDEALSALGTFVAEVGLPEPVRVDSGTGIQAYWAFDNDVPMDEWRLYAEVFKNFCIEKGLLIDPSVTADASRIMRCPETYNYKTDPPNLAYVLDDEIYQYDFAEFKAFLGEVEPVKVLDPIFATKPTRELDADTKAILKDNFEYVFHDIAEKSLEGTGCNQIRYILENAAVCHEPLWYAGLSVAVRCVDGAESIHLMSEDHPGYSRDRTEQKAAQSFRNATWAHSCSAFEKEYPAGCVDCPHRGKLRSGSPIDLGRQLAEAPTLEQVAEAEPKPDAEPEFAALPDYLKPFVRGKNGGIWYIPKKKKGDDGEDSPEPVCLTSNDLYAVKRLEAGVDKDCLLMRHVMPLDPIREFLMPLKCVYAADKMKQILAENGVNFHVSLTQRMFEYLSKWDVYLQHKMKVEIMRMQMGWSENRDVFVIGDLEIAKHGGERPAATSPGVRNISKLVKRVGNYDTWKQSANALNAVGFELHALGLLMGFGSPIMCLTSTPGSSICFTSTDSGIGKSGALYAGLSVFSDPYNISVLEGAATDNAFIGRYLGLKNIMFGIDEASNIDPEALSKILHRISQGKAKLRMQSSVNAERELEQSASLLGGFTSNQSLYDKLFTLKGAPQGELARLIEFPMRKPKQLENDPLCGPRIFNAFRENYGWAGPEYIQHLFKQGDLHISKILTKWLNLFINDYGGQTEYRFYMNSIAACFAGGELAVEAGIINLDLDRIYKVVIGDMIHIRDNTVRPGSVDYKALLSDFYYKNLQSFLIFSDGNRVTTEPRSSNLVGRVEVDNRKIYISKAEFKKFLVDKQLSPREFERALERENILAGTEKRRLSSGWKAGTGATPPITVYVFNSALTEEIAAKTDE